MNIPIGRIVASLAIGLALFAPQTALAADGLDESMSRYLSSKLPDRPTGPIPGGKALLAAYHDTTIAKREEAVLDALNRGYFPDVMRKLKAVTIRDKGHTLTFWVMPDYVAIGNNDDNVLIPLSFVSARKLANSWGFILPTTRMVDAIFGQAECVMWPRIFPPSAAMVSVAWLEAHSDLIHSQRLLEFDFTRLAAGHKKDIVLSPRLKSQGKKIAIYGWQNIRAGENIQPLSTWHGERYVDYSHGLRLVGSWGMLDGRLVPMKEIMADPELSSLVSREGPISVDQILSEPLETANHL
ncbi:MAG TPA: hypothetical protein VE954_28430 [Oligoflexus sp.]|uniref:hypothetical protein n=1 Tax=Oligoflexus sp. TaxID=1971216 RepID=UPI002D6717CE|nr:hypothetical protein [Oligoflexus sp.]HYX37047.1 hypothetical protein [Oligoflexus sp.]